MSASIDHKGIDAVILQRIPAGVTTLRGLMSDELVLQVINEAASAVGLASPDVERIIDRRLQALRRSGLADFSRSSRAWEVAQSS